MGKNVVGTVERLTPTWGGLDLDICSGIANELVSVLAHQREPFRIGVHQRNGRIGKFRNTHDVL